MFWDGFLPKSNPRPAPFLKGIKVAGFLRFIPRWHATCKVEVFAATLI